MAKAKQRTYAEALGWLREHGFELLDAPDAANRSLLKKYNCSAAIEAAGDGVKIIAYPGCLVGGEIAKLVNQGYQQFLRTSKASVPATADRLTELHRFTEEFKEALSLPSLFNESLGTVSEDYHYDRLAGRDGQTRSPRPWDKGRKPTS